MYICLCNAITDRQIADAASRGARDPEDLARELGIGSGCGRCVSCAATVLSESIAGMAASTEKLAA